MKRIIYVLIYFIAFFNSGQSIGQDLVPYKTDMVPYKTDMVPYKTDMVPFRENMSPPANFAEGVKNNDIEEFNRVLKYIKDNNANAIIIFSGEWCSACKKFHSNTINPMSKKIKTSYVLYTVDVDKCIDHPLIRYMRDNGMLKFYPSYIMITSGGKELVAHGFGNKSQEDFLKWIENAVYNWKIKKNRNDR